MMTFDTLSFLLGRWSLQRRVEDLHTNSHVEIVGIVSLIDTTANRRSPLSAHSASYEEQGELTISGRQCPMHRHLIYTQVQNSRVISQFDDGRIFTDLDLRSGSWHTTYLCGDDRYKLTTVVVSQSEVREYWRVIGHNKDYIATTVLKRCTDRNPHTSPMPYPLA